MFSEPGLSTATCVSTAWQPVVMNITTSTYMHDSLYSD